MRPDERPADPDAYPSRSDAADEHATRDLGWLDRVRTGDEAAFASLFQAYAEGLCNFVYGYVQSREIAQEIVQDLFFRLWEQRFSWEVRGTVRAYLYFAVRNRALNVLRSRRIEGAFLARTLAQQAIDQPEAIPVALDVLEEHDVADAVARVVAELPPRCREVFVLKREQHLSYLEIAELLQITPKTVEVHMGRALTILRQRLAHLIR